MSVFSTVRELLNSITRVRDLANPPAKQMVEDGLKLREPILQQQQLAESIQTKNETEQPSLQETLEQAQAQMLENMRRNLPDEPSDETLDQPQTPNKPR